MHEYLKIQRGISSVCCGNNCTMDVIHNFSVENIQLKQINGEAEFKNALPRTVYEDILSIKTYEHYPAVTEHQNQDSKEDIKLSDENDNKPSIEYCNKSESLYIKEEQRDCCDDRVRTWYNIARFTEPLSDTQPWPSLRIKLEKIDDMVDAFLKTDIIVVCKKEDEGENKESSYIKAEPDNARDEGVHNQDDTSSVSNSDVCKPFVPKKTYVRRKDRLRVEDYKGKGKYTEKKFSCPVCGKGFVRPCYVREHMWRHTGWKDFLCLFCDKQFTRQVALAEHVAEQHTGKMPYMCTACKMVIISYKDLTQHMLQHSYNEPSVCKVCMRVFPDPEKLEAHKFAHKDVCSFTCRYCQKDCQNSQYLLRHENAHKKIKPHRCPLCEKSFSQSSHLERHLRIHSGVKPYKCSECLKCFSRTDKLSQHMLCHSKEQAHKCEICSKAFGRKDNLMFHVKTTHSGREKKRESRRRGRGRGHRRK